MRRAGLTFAPEAGTQRLRDVINKNETEESILETVDIAFASGWNRIKLYFMIGLPTETDDDLEGIARLVSKVRVAARKQEEGRGLERVGVAVRAPKPHTPFQWETAGLAGGDEARRRGSSGTVFARSAASSSPRDPEVSFLEGVMSRGDRSLAGVVEAAFRAGARFDGVDRDVRHQALARRRSRMRVCPPRPSWRSVTRLPRCRGTTSMEDRAGSSCWPSATRRGAVSRPPTAGRPAASTAGRVPDGGVARGAGAAGDAREGRGTDRGTGTGSDVRPARAQGPPGRPER